MKITVLVENECRDQDLRAEHGLSLFLEYGGEAYLLDAGETELFDLNAASLRCDLSALRAAVLSHGHFDHANGFTTLLRQNKRIKVYARPAVMEPRYNGKGRYDGLAAPLLEEYASRFDLSDETRAIAPGFWLVPDAVDHEQSLVAETKGGLVVMNSCCHAGADHIVADILERFPGQRVRALVGGLHLMGPGGVSTLGKDPGQVRALARRLTAELGVEEVYTGHCTGAPAFALLAQAAPGKVHTIHTGHTLEF